MLLDEVKMWNICSDFHVPRTLVPHTGSQDMRLHCCFWMGKREVAG